MLVTIKSIFSLFFVFASTLAIAQHELSVAFTIPEKDLIPEGITFDPIGNAFYLGSIHKRKIVRITSKGEVSDFVVSGKDSLLQVLGMTVHSGNLWVCNNTPEDDTVFMQAQIHVYELKSKRLVKRFTLNDGKRHLFNDIYLSKTGDAFITDSHAGAVYQIKNNSEKITELSPPSSVIYPNGIAATENEDKLFVSTGSGRGIVTIDVTTGAISDLPNERYFVFGYDGIYRYKKSLIGVQNVVFPAAVHQLMLDKDEKQITELKFLSGNDPRFNVPTTGVVVQSSFYFIANSQLMQLEKGEIKSPETLTATYIMKLTLN